MCKQVLTMRKLPEHTRQGACPVRTQVSWLLDGLKSFICLHLSMPPTVSSHFLIASLASSTLHIPISLEMEATIGAAPVPVPPPIPAVMNTRSAPWAHAQPDPGSVRSWLMRAGDANAPLHAQSSTSLAYAYDQDQRRQTLPGRPPRMRAIFRGNDTKSGHSTLAKASLSCVCTC